jgi:hypothetical protein
MENLSLGWAASLGHSVIAELLMKTGADVMSMTQNTQLVPLKEAAAWDDLFTVRLLLNPAQIQIIVIAMDGPLYIERLRRVIGMLCFCCWSTRLWSVRMVLHHCIVLQTEDTITFSRSFFVMEPTLSSQYVTVGLHYTMPPS